jgi:hypothetical protein
MSLVFQNIDPPPPSPPGECVPPAFVGGEDTLSGRRRRLSVAQPLGTSRGCVLARTRRRRGGDRLAGL